MANTSKGQCTCGDIQFEFTGDPINSAFCYCRSCQKLTNSDKWFGLWVPVDNFRFTLGSPSTYSRLGDSGKKMLQKYCSNCSTTLAIEVEVAGFYSVAATAVDGAEVLSPNMCIYTSHAPNWAVFPEDVPKFNILPPEFSGES